MPTVSVDLTPILKSKIQKAARTCGVSEPTMLGHVHLLWYWAAVYQDDGDLSGYSNEDIADFARWEGEPDHFVYGLTRNFGPHGSLITEPGRSIDGWGEYILVRLDNLRRYLPDSKRRAILDRDGWLCVNCGTPRVPGVGPSGLHIDHIVPVSRGGSDAESNLQVLCSDCNINKGARTQDEWEQSGRADEMKTKNASKANEIKIRGMYGEWSVL
jgi:hypothetical protein